MPSFLAVANAVATVTGSALAAGVRRSIAKDEKNYQGASDAQIHHCCCQALQAGPAHEPSQSQFRFRALSFASREQLSPRRLRNLRLGVTAFARRPADLPPGSRLYPEQVQAAGALLQRSLVQMDTGEGKTYVFLPVGFALSVDFATVFIVCANDYLAHRDATRTRSYWEFVGLGVGLALDSTDDTGWDAPIVYTTLKQLMFRFLNTDLKAQKPRVPWDACAALLDEADAILLDQGGHPYQLTRARKEATLDVDTWQVALAIARTLTEDDQVTVDRVGMHATLTATGESHLRRFNPRNDDESHFKLRYAVESAYIALAVAEQDVDYVSLDGRLALIDAQTGKVNVNTIPSWLVALETEFGLPHRSVDVRTDEVVPTYVLRKFGFVAGASGTLRPDALEYLFSYGLPSVIVPPRRERQHGELDALVYLYASSARKVAAGAALEVLASGKPVLVATQTISDAEAFYHELDDSALPPGANVQLVTGKNDWDAAEIFERAGDPYTLTIATQLAGRGVDIRLNEGARDAGGLALYCLGHSVTQRHDRQILGRVGRQGDPFISQFICSLEDQLLKIFSGDQVMKLMKSMGMPDDEPITHSLVTRSIKNAQKKLAENAFLQRRHADYADRSVREIRDEFVQWTRSLQALPDDEPDPCFRSERGREYLLGLVDDLMNRHVTERLGRVAVIDAEVASTTTEDLKRILGEGAWLDELAERIYGLPSSHAIGAVKEGLQERLDASLLVFDGLVTIDPSMSRFSPRVIAHRTLALQWEEYLNERDRIKQEVAGSHVSALEFMRRLAHEYAAAWKAKESWISAAILEPLLKADRPALLEGRLMRLESTQSTLASFRERPVLAEMAFIERLDKEEPEAREDLLGKARVRQRLLVEQFMADRKLSNLPDARARRLLMDFLAANPLVILQASEHVTRALELWDREAPDDLSPSAKKEARRLLVQFIDHLHRRGHIAGLPSARARVANKLARVRAAVSSFEVLLPVFVAALLIASGWAVNVVAGMRVSYELTGTRALIDTVFFGGLVQGGSIAQIGLAALAVARAVSIAVGYRNAERLIGLPLVITVSVALADWGAARHGLLPTAGVVGFVLLGIVLGHFGMRAVWFLENAVGLSLFQLWLAFNATVSGGKLLTDASGEPWLVASSVALVMLIQLFSKHVNRTAIPLESDLMLSSISLESRTVRSSTVIHSGSKFLPCLVGLVTAVFAMQVKLPPFLSDSLPSAPAHRALVGYAVGFLLAVLQQHRTRFSREVWQGMFSRHQQRLADGRRLSDVLLLARLKATGLEVLALAATFAVAIRIAPHVDSIFGIPPSIVLMLVAGIGAAAWYATWQEAWSLLLVGRAPVEFELALLRPRGEDSTEKRSRWVRAFVRIRRNWIAYTGLLLALLGEVQNDHSWMKRAWEAAREFARIPARHLGPLAGPAKSLEAWFAAHSTAVYLGLGALALVVVWILLGRRTQGTAATSSLSRLTVPSEPPNAAPKRARIAPRPEAPMPTPRRPLPAGALPPRALPAAPRPVPQSPFVGREMPNLLASMPCPCGSGKKFARCHGAFAGDDLLSALEALETRETLDARETLEDPEPPTVPTNAKRVSGIELRSPPENHDPIAVPPPSQVPVRSGIPAPIKLCPCGSGRAFSECHGAVGTGD